jgi:hypothetical protein
MSDIASITDAANRKEPISEPAAHAQSQSVASINAWFCFAVWAAFALPMFIRMPLTNDTCLFDIQARMVTEGGTLYKDMHEPNLPGVVWLQMLARTIGGESSETMRAFDLLFFAGILGSMFCFCRCQKTSLCSPDATASSQSTTSRRHAVWTIASLSVFYLSLSEWCHCQRDTWVLLPVLIGALLRLRQINRAHQTVKSENSSSLFTFSLLEGLVWAGGIWIKPHVVISILAVWLISFQLMPNRRAAVLDAAGLLVGGIGGGILGIGWLLYSGAWPFFVATLTNWNPDYLAAARENWTWPRFVAMFTRFFPWMLVHLVALPIAFAAVFVRSARASQRILAAIYLTWLVHSFFLQHLFDYVHVPAIILGVSLVSTHAGTANTKRLFALIFGVFACLVVAGNPLLKKDRLQLWQDCLTHSASSELQDRLSFFDNPRRGDLGKVIEFLQSKNVKQNEVCCFNSDCVSVYWELDLLPATRFTYLFELMNYHPTRAADFQAALESSPHRFIVTDLVSSGMSLQDASAIDPRTPLIPPSYPKAKNVYPWSHPIVFRAGTYLVHEVQQPIGKLKMPRRRR